MSSPFTDDVFIQPNLIPVGRSGGIFGWFQKDIYLQVDPWSIIWTANGKRYRMYFKRGNVTDIASVPRFLWFFITPDGEHRGAALPHDELYQYQGKLPDGRLFVEEDGKWKALNGCVWSKNDADKFFANILDRIGVKKFKRRAMYLGVHFFGGGPWRKVYKPLLTPERIEYLLQKYDAGRLLDAKDSE